MSSPSAITLARRELATALGTDQWPCHYAVPESIEPACYVLQGGNPYVAPVEADDTFDTREVSVAIVVFVLPELRSNEQAINDLDAMLDHLLTALPEGWGLDLIGGPQALETSNWLAFGQPVTVSRFITL